MLGAAGPGGQSYVERPPVAALAGLVSAMWVQAVAPDSEPYALDADELWGSAAVSLRERVDAAATPEQALAAMQRELVGRMGDTAGPDPLISEAVRQLMPWGALALLAADAGYADQPHPTRECVRLTGVTPRAFLGETADTCACGHDHAASFTPLLRSRPSAA